MLCVSSSKGKVVGTFVMDSKFISELSAMKFLGKTSQKKQKPNPIASMHDKFTYTIPHLYTINACHSCIFRSSRGWYGKARKESIDSVSRNLSGRRGWIHVGWQIRATSSRRVVSFNGGLVSQGILSKMPHKHSGVGIITLR